MGTPDRQDDHLLTIPGLSEAEKMEVCVTVAKGRGVAHALSVLGRFMDDLDVALREDPEFAREYQMALTLRDEEIENALHKKARKGNVTAMKFYLTNRRPDQWSDTRTTRHVGPSGGPIEVAAVVAGLRDVLTAKETRDDAIAWIERDSDIVEAELVDSGADAPGEDSDPGEAG